MLEGNILKPISHDEKRELGKLRAMPIFRANDLYVKLFPEIDPTFNQGEEPDSKKIFEILNKYQGNEIIFDQTCVQQILSRTKADEIPADLNFTPKSYIKNEENGEIFANLYDTKFFDCLEEKWNLKFGNKYALVDLMYNIDYIIDEKTGWEFSREIVKTYYELAKQKNPNFKKIIILTDCINSHAFNASDGKIFSKEEVLDLLREGAIQYFSIEPEMIPTIKEADIESEDLVILDRHNKAANDNLPNRKPEQTILLPLYSELYNYQKITGKDLNFDTKILRELFEVKE